MDTALFILRPFVIIFLPKGIGHDQTSLSPLVAVDLAQIGVGHHCEGVASESHQNYSNVEQRNDQKVTSSCQHFISRYLHVDPKTERKRVETMMTFLPNLSASIESKMSPTTLPTN